MAESAAIAACQPVGDSAGHYIGGSNINNMQGGNGEMGGAGPLSRVVTLLHQRFQ